MFQLAYSKPVMSFNKTASRGPFVKGNETPIFGGHNHFRLTQLKSGTMLLVATCSIAQFDLYPKS